MAKAAAAKAVKSKALVKWDEELAKQAQIATETEAGVGGGSFIGTARGTLKYQGAEVPGNEMNVVILDHILENSYYSGSYDPDNPQAPVCFAFGRTEDDMRPHEASKEPQSETCAGCPQNEWGSAEVGRGKACKNIRRLGLLAESDLEDVPGAEAAFLKLPVMSVKPWAGYVRQLADVYKRPPLGVVTNLKLVPDDKSQFKILSTLSTVIEDGEVIGHLLAKKEALELDFPYTYNENPAPSPKTARSRKVLPVPQKARAAAAGVGRKAVPLPASSAAKRSKF